MSVLDDELKDEKLRMEGEKNQTNLDRVTEKSEIDLLIRNDYVAVHW